MYGLNREEMMIVTKISFFGLVFFFCLFYLKLIVKFTFYTKFDKSKHEKS